MRSPTSQAFCLPSCVSSHLSVRRRDEEGFNPDVDCSRGGLQTRPDWRRVERLAIGSQRILHKFLASAEG